MPPIHREKSLDEYCNNSNVNVPTNKRNSWNSAVKNGIQLSPPDATRTKRVSEGSSNSNCSSSSDTFEANNLKPSPIPKNTLSNASSCSLKSDCLYASSNSTSNGLIHNSAEMQFNNIENKVKSSVTSKHVLNDIKMEMQDLNQEHCSDVFFQKELKPIQTPQNFGTDNFSISETANFSPASLPNQF